MQTSTSITEEGKLQLSASFSAEEVDAYIAAAFKEMSRVRIQGFRPGRAPKKMVERAHGGHEVVYGQLAADFIQEKAPLAIDAEDLIFIDEPSFGDQSFKMEDGQEFSFSFTATPKPRVELLSFEPVAINMPVAAVSDEEVNEQVEMLRQYYYDFKSVDDRAVADEDYLQVDLACTAEDGSEIPGLNSKNRMVQLGKGVMPYTFDAHLIGMEKGETREFDFSAAGVEGFEFMGEGPIHAVVTVNEIRAKVMPELNDDFAKQAGMNTFEELVDEMRRTLEFQKEASLPQLKEHRSLAKLAQRIHGSVPEEYVQYTRTEMLQQFFNRLQQQETTFDAWLQQNQLTPDQFQADLDLEAKDQAAQNLALDALARERGIVVEEEDIVKEFSAVDNPEEVRAQWEAAGRMAYIREGILRGKACEWLMETAIVTETDEPEPEVNDPNDQLQIP